MFHSKKKESAAEKDHSAAVAEPWNALDQRQIARTNKHGFVHEKKSKKVMSPLGTFLKTPNTKTFLILLSKQRSHFLALGRTRNGMGLMVALNNI